MSAADRYARQRSVPGVGDRGQARLAAAYVRVDGDGAASEVAALYLVGAGVGRVAVHPRWAEACRSHNREVRVEAGADAGDLAVSVGSARHVPAPGADVDRGARAARWALARVLSS